MSVKISIVMREIVVGMLRAMTMAVAEETQHDSNDKTWETLHVKVEGFINWLEQESPLS